MTVAVETPWATNNADGAATVFPVGFSYSDPEEVAVSVVLNGAPVAADYTIIDGNVVFTLPPPAGAQVQRSRATALDQQEGFPATGRFPSTSFELQLDRLTRAAQDQQAAQRFTLRAPDFAGIDPLPPASSRALNYLAFDAAGNPVAVPGAQTINLGGDGFSLGAEAMGAAANNGLVGVANVAAIRLALAILGARGGGDLQFGAGLFTLDAAALGAGGIIIPGGVRVRGIGAMTILQSTDLTFTGNPVFAGNGGAVLVEDMTLRGRAVFSNLTGGGMRRVRLEGNLSETQYTRVAANFVSAFAAPTFNDGAGGTPAADYTWALVGNVGTMTLDATVGLLGTAAYYRYAQSAAITLDPTKRYVVRFLDGFYTGAGAAEPQLTIYDGSGNPVDAKQGLAPYVGAPVNNLHKPNNDRQFVGTGAGGADEPGAWQVSYISGASKLKLAVGGFRHYATAPGLAASFDFSKVEVLQLVNDFAGFALNNLPTNAAWVQFSGCANVGMVDCIGYGVAGRVALLNNCTASEIRDCRVSFCTHGFGDDNGNNAIHDNRIDQRFRADDGTLRGMRAYRWKGIGGVNSTGRVYNNLIIGASWGIEILPYDVTKNYGVYDNTVWAEFAAYSLGNGRFFARGNRAHLSSDGLFGMELPGSTDSAQFIHANAEENFIEWSDFSGYLGFGYSCSTYRDIKIKGGFVRAPYLVQGVNGQSGATLVIDGLDGEFGVCALLGRGSAGANGLIYQASFGKLQPMKVCLPYGTGALDAIVDIFMSSGTGHLVSITAERINVGAGRCVQTAGVANIDLALREIRNPAAYRSLMPLFIAPPAAEALSARLAGNDFISPPAAMSASTWCQISGTPYTGSSIVMRGNKWDTGPCPAPSGTGYSPAIVRGDPLMVVYKSGVAPGTLAAGATFDVALSINGIAATDQAFDVESYVAGGLDGLAWSCWATGDNAGVLRLRNITGVSTGFPTQTLRITARRTI